MIVAAPQAGGPVVIATFGPTTGWVGKTIAYENQQYVLEGHGPITTEAVAEYDRQGFLNWASEEWRRFACALPDGEWQGVESGGSGQSGGLSQEPDPAVDSEPAAATDPSATADQADSAAIPDDGGVALDGESVGAPTPRPEAGELARLEARLADLTEDLAARERDLTAGRRELLDLQTRYLSIVGARLAELEGRGQ